MGCRAWDTGKVGQDRKDAEHVGCRTGGMQDRCDTGQVSYRTGVMHDRTGSG